MLAHAIPTNQYSVVLKPEIKNLTHGRLGKLLTIPFWILDFLPIILALKYIAKN